MHATVCMGRTEDSFWESSLHTIYVLGLELRLPGLVASTFAFWAISTAHVIQLLSPFPGCFSLLSLLHSQFLYSSPVLLLLNHPGWAPLLPQSSLPRHLRVGAERHVFSGEICKAVQVQKTVSSKKYVRGRSVALECWVSRASNKNALPFKFQAG